MNQPRCTNVPLLLTSHIPPHLIPLGFNHPQSWFLSHPFSSLDQAAFRSYIE